MRKFCLSILIIWLSLLTSCSAPDTTIRTPLPGLPPATLPPLPLLIPTITTTLPTFTQPVPSLIPLPSSTAQPTITPINPLACPSQPPATGWCIAASHFILQRPISPPYSYTVEPSYRYGTTQNYTRDPHHGVEFYNPQGTPVQAAASGIVLVAGSDESMPISPWQGIYGNAVVIEHHLPAISETLYTVYGHLSQVIVSVGDTVTEGQYIGYVGASGAALGSHLHFEVRLAENSFYATRNPELWLQPVKSAPGILSGAIAGQVNPINLNTGRTLQLTLQSIVDDQLVGDLIFFETYNRTLIHPEDPWQEHFALSDLPPGDYRLVLVANGKVHEHQIQIFSGQLTWIVFNINP